MPKNTGTDAEIADWFIKAIENPLTVRGATGDIESLRPQWIREAERAIKTMTDRAAITRLQQCIDSYSQDRINKSKQN